MSSSPESAQSENRIYWIAPLLIVAALVGWLLLSEGESAVEPIDTDENFDYDAR